MSSSTEKDRYGDDSAYKYHMAKQSLQSLLQNLGFRIEQLATTLTDRFEPK